MIPRARNATTALPFLRLADFRYLGTAMVLSSVGMIGEVVVLGWLALDLTNSPFLVGVAMGMRGLPMFFLGAPAGVIADRFPRHRLLIATSIGQAATTATLGLLTLFGLVTFTHLVLLTLIAGAARGLEHSARQSYTHDVVGPADLMNALAMLGLATRAGWLPGSLGAGALIAQYGPGLAYLAVAVSHLAAAVALIPTSAPEGTTPPASGSLWQSLVDFITAMRRDPLLPALMILAGGAEVLGFAHQAIFPSLARDVLGVGAEGLGAMNAARSVGGILGLLMVSMRRAVYGSGRLFLAVLVAFGASLVALGLAPARVGFVGVLVILVVANAAGALADLLAQSLMQLSVPAHLRGRAGGAWVVAIGLAPLGQLQIGALASLFGVSVALGASGAALVMLAVGGALLFPRVRRL